MEPLSLGLYVLPFLTGSCGHQGLTYLFPESLTREGRRDVGLGRKPCELEPGVQVTWVFSPLNLRDAQYEDPLAAQPRGVPPAGGRCQRLVPDAVTPFKGCRLLPVL